MELTGNSGPCSSLKRLLFLYFLPQQTNCLKAKLGIRWQACGPVIHYILFRGQAVPCVLRRRHWPWRGPGMSQGGRNCSALWEILSSLDSYEHNTPASPMPPITSLCGPHILSGLAVSSPVICNHVTLVSLAPPSEEKPSWFLFHCVCSQACFGFLFVLFCFNK